MLSCPILICPNEAWPDDVAFWKGYLDPSKQGGSPSVQEAIPSLGWACRTNDIARFGLPEAIRNNQKDLTL